MQKQRLDVLMVDRGLAESREKAQRLILAGVVTVAGTATPKPGTTVATDAEIQVAQPARFVSRGGEKLEHAFEFFKLDVTGLLCVDVGASTGGFTDCLLQHGAAGVYAVDCGKGQLHWKLRQDPRVRVMEGINARHLEQAAFPEQPRFAVVDVSFISLALILPAVLRIVTPGSGVVTLIKPQFEAGRSQVGRGGVVRDEQVRQEVVDRIRQIGENQLGLRWHNVTQSPITGPAGNVEFLAFWQAPAPT